MTEIDGDPTPDVAHVVDYLIPEGETPECVEDCPGCLAPLATIENGSEDDDPEPCGESGCLCYGVGEEHADCACGCDCPRYWDEEGSHLIGEDG